MQTLWQNIFGGKYIRRACPNGFALYYIETGNARPSYWETTRLDLVLSGGKGFRKKIDVTDCQEIDG